MSAVDRLRSADAQQGAACRVDVLDVVLQIRYGNEVAAVFNERKKLLSFFLGELAFRDVMRHYQHRGAFGIIHGVRKELHVNGRAVFQAMTPLSRGALPCGFGLKAEEQPGNFVRRMKVADTHLQELDPLISVAAKSGVVDLKDLQACFFEYPHGK